MLTESQLRKAIRGILIREMKTTDYWAGEPIVRRLSADAGEAPSAPPSHSPVTTAIRLLRAAKDPASPMGEEISMAIRASVNDPASLLALARISTGMTAVTKFSTAEIETLEAAIRDLGKEGQSEK